MTEPLSKSFCSLCMAIVVLVIERTKRPFILPWITPPTPEDQTSSAKALVQDILGDGISGQPSSNTNDIMEGSTTLVVEGSTRRSSLKSQEPARKSTTSPDITNISEAKKHSQTMTAERKGLWHQLDEGGQCVPSPMPPMPSPAKFNIQSEKRRSSYKTLATSHPSPEKVPEVSSYPGMKPKYSVRPRAPAAGHARYSPGVAEPENRGLLSVGENAEGKKLFNRAVEGLRDSRAKGRSGYEDWSNMKMPGSFVEW